MAGVVKVSSVADLLKALKTATAGETIALAPGNYSGLAISGFNFASPVTITSQDSAHQADLQGLKLSNSSGLTFSNMELSTVGVNDAYGVRVTGASNVIFSGLNVHGSLDNNPSNDISGLYITDSSGITIQNSQFQQLGVGVVEANSSHVNITNNSFHDIRSDGIDNAGSSFVTISSNTFTSFHPSASDHPDAIQFWTLNTTAPAHDIVIANNAVTLGNGEIAQGIFLTDQTGKLPYQNVTISNNIVLGMMYNGIMVDGAKNLNLNNNTVIGYSGQQSWIRIADVQGAALTNNAASSYIFGSGNSKLTETGDIKAELITPGKSTLASLLLSNSPLGYSSISHTTSFTASLLQMTR